MDLTPYEPISRAPIFKAISNAIGALERAGAAGLPDNWYATAAEIRALTSYTDNDVVGLTSGYLYQFDAADVHADDGVIYLCPSNITHPAPGRWVRVVSFSLAGHTHTDKMNLPAVFTPNEFYIFNSAGEFIASTYGPDSFVPVDPHKGLSTNDFTDEYKDILDNLPEEIDPTGKMDKVTPTADNDGNIVLLDSEGNASDSGIKPSDLVKISAEADKEITSFPGSVIFDVSAVGLFDMAEIRTVLIYGINKVGLKIDVDNQGAGGAAKSVKPSHRDSNNQLNDYTITYNNVLGVTQVTITLNTGPGTVTVKRPKIILT